jgi:simple sugar transport system substrate-binding protein
MVDYLTANRTKVKAIIGLGDLVTGSIKRVFDQVGVKPGEIPVVGWGNSLDTTQEVLQGYVNAAQWQDPQATSYVALSLANMAASGIPPGFNVITGALYEKDTAEIYDKILEGFRQPRRAFPPRMSASFRGQARRGHRAAPILQ